MPFKKSLLSKNPHLMPFYLTLPTKLRIQEGMLMLMFRSYRGDSSCDDILYELRLECTYNLAKKREWILALGYNSELSHSTVRQRYSHCNCIPCCKYSVLWTFNWWNHGHQYNGTIFIDTAICRRAHGGSLWFIWILQCSYSSRENLFM